MTTETTTERIRNIAAIWAGTKPDEIKPETSFVDDLGFDSLDQIEMVMEVESEFGIEVSDEDAEQVRTVADAVALVEKVQALQAA